MEDVGGTSWRASLLTTLGSQFGSAMMRFVGRATSMDSPWPTYAYHGGTFPRPRSIPDDLPPDESHCPGMTESLAKLRERLEQEGWLSAGHGAAPWSFRYLRPRIAW